MTVYVVKRKDEEDGKERINMRDKNANNKGRKETPQTE
jgi:hypothetical protein